jgi:hypothetical protein
MKNIIKKWLGIKTLEEELKDLRFDFGMIVGSDLDRKNWTQKNIDQWENEVECPKTLIKVVMFLFEKYKSKEK